MMRPSEILAKLKRLSRGITEDERSPDKGTPDDPASRIQIGGQAWLADPPADIQPARRLLQKYSGIRAKDVETHIHSIVRRDHRVASAVGTCSGWYILIDS
jgi:hypothetical protein